jgi:hypothetical protein
MQHIENWNWDWVTTEQLDKESKRLKEKQHKCYRGCGDKHVLTLRVETQYLDVDLGGLFFKRRWVCGNCNEVYTYKHCK